MLVFEKFNRSFLRTSGSIYNFTLCFISHENKNEPCTNIDGPIYTYEDDKYSLTCYLLTLTVTKDKISQTGCRYYNSMLILEEVAKKVRKYLPEAVNYK